MHINNNDSYVYPFLNNIDFLIIFFLIIFLIILKKFDCSFFFFFYKFEVFIWKMDVQRYKTDFMKHYLWNFIVENGISIFYAFESESGHKNCLQV